MAGQIPWLGTGRVLFFGRISDIKPRSRWEEGSPLRDASEPKGTCWLPLQSRDWPQALTSFSRHLLPITCGSMSQIPSYWRSSGRLGSGLGLFASSGTKVTSALECHHTHKSNLPTPFMARLSNSFHFYPTNLPHLQHPSSRAYIIT